MARKPMVTRSFDVTKVNVMCVDTNAGEVINKDFELPRTYKDDEKILKTVQSIITDAGIKAVSVVDKSVVSKLYGMSEVDFLKYSVELDPETRKMLETSEDETEDDSEDESEN